MNAQKLAKKLVKQVASFLKDDAHRDTNKAAHIRKLEVLLSNGFVKEHEALRLYTEYKEDNSTVGDEDIQSESGGRAGRPAKHLKSGFKKEWSAMTLEEKRVFVSRFNDTDGYKASVSKRTGVISPDSASRKKIKAMMVAYARGDYRLVFEDKKTTFAQVYPTDVLITRA